MKKSQRTTTASRRQQNSSGDLPLYLMRLFTAVWVFLIMAVLPLYMHNGYYDIGDVKWAFFVTVTWGIRGNGLFIPAFIPLMVILLIWYAFCRRMTPSDIFRGLQNCSVTDIFAAFYAAAVVLSYLFSPYKQDAFWGSEGFYMGFAAQISFILIYFLISRFWHKNFFPIAAGLAAFAVVCLIGNLNRFNIDPLHVYTLLTEEDKVFFLSTLGQSSWYSCYLCLPYSTAVFLYWHSKKSLSRMASLVCLVLGSFAIVTLNADSAFAALAVMLFLLLYFSTGSRRLLQRLSEILIVILLSWRAAGFLQLLFPGNAVLPGKLCIFLSQSPFLYIPLAAAILFRFSLLRTQNSSGLSQKKPGNPAKIRKILLWSAAGFIGLLLVYIILNSKGKLPASLSTRNSYLTFTDLWGNSRGSIWQACAQTFSALLHDSPLHALFGAGPDCFFRIVYDKCGNMLHAYWGSGGYSINNAHNEYLHTLLSTGIAGLTIYLGLLITAIRRFSAHCTEKPALIAILLAVTSYAVQNIVCYQTVTSTPLFFIALGIGEYMLQNMKST